MPERFTIYIVYKRRYINTLSFLLAAVALQYFSRQYAGALQGNLIGFLVLWT